MVPSINGFHIEPTNICTLKCPGCSRTQFINQFGKHWLNHSINIEELCQFLDVDLSGKSISFCGNYGDPIYHHDLIGLVSFFKKKHSIITITTNGSYKTESWWNKLCQILDENDKIVFSVDGSPENFKNYRINANWESIKVGMQTVGKSPIKSTWKYIPFNYNVDTINQTQELARQIGIKNFKVSPSDRFDQHTEHLIPLQEFLGARKASQDNFKDNQKIEEIEKECNNGKMHYISADGYYSPCCYSADHRFRYKTVFGKAAEQFNIRKHTLTEILSAPKTVEFYNTIQDDKPAVCQFNCPKTPKVV